MKYSLKNEYKSLLKEVKVAIETPDNYYDYDFPDSTDFRTISFYDGDKEIEDAKLVKIIPKTNTSSDTFNRMKGIYGVTDFIDKYLNDELMKSIYNYCNNKNIDKSSTINIKDVTGISSNSEQVTVSKEFKNIIYTFIGGSLSYFVIQILKNVLISDRKVYGKLIEHYKSENSDELPVEILKKCIIKKLNNNSVILNTLKEISIFKQQKIEANISFFTMFKDILRSDDINIIITKYKKIKTYLEFYFKERSRQLGSRIVAQEVWPVIAREYITNSNEVLSILLREIKNFNNSSSYEERLSIRRNVKTLDEVEGILAKINRIDNIKRISSSYPPANRKGRGEFLCHMLFNTQNACLSIEPDVVLPNGVNLSVKSSFSGEARTGENMDLSVRDLLNQIISIAMPNLSNRDISFLTVDTLSNAIESIGEKISLAGIENIENTFNEVNNKNYNHINVNDFKSLYNSLKVEIITEHDASGIIHHDHNDNLKIIKKASLVGNEITLSALKNNRWSFNFNRNSTKSFETAFFNLIKKMDDELTNLKRQHTEDGSESVQNKLTGQSDAYVPKGKVLKEVYSNLFDIKATNNKTF